MIDTRPAARSALAGHVSPNAFMRVHREVMPEILINRMEMEMPQKDAAVALPQFVVEEGFQLPEITSAARGRKSKYPFETMKEGDSFWMPADVRDRVAGAAQSYGNKRGLKFVIAPSDTAMGGFRCWHAGKRPEKAPSKAAPQK